jgi:DNA-binding IscR family transcriptional regulator
VGGGYSFAREPSEVTVLEVVELLDGPVGQEANGVFAEAAAAARTVLAGYTIAEIAEAEAQAAGAHMYHI